MAFRLIVRFGGLCAFAPRRDGHRAWVFFPDAQDFGDPSLGTRAHHAVVTFSLKDLSLPVEVARLLGEVDGLWNLLHDDLFILPSGMDIPAGAENLVIEGFDPDDREDPPLSKLVTPDGRFSYLAPLEKASVRRGNRPGGGDLLSEFLVEPRLDKNLAEVLAARVHLKTGNLRVLLHTIDSEKVPIAWRFRSFKGEERVQDHVQVLASEVAVTVQIQDFVRLQAFDHIKQVTRFLDFSPPDGTSDVVIRIRNEESEQFLPEPTTPAVAFKLARAQDRLFELFYLLSKNPPPPAETPIPVADYSLGADQGGGADSSPPCSPSRLNAV